MIEKVIALISPSWGLRRAKTRSALKRYQAASRETRHETWKTGSSSANEQIKTALPHLMARSRQLTRDASYPAKAEKMLVCSRIGCGIFPQAKESEMHDEIWNKYANSKLISPDRRNNVYSLMALAARTMIKSGAVLIRRYRRPRPGLVIPLQLQALEPDYIDILRDGETLKSGNYIRQGIEFDSLGEIKAYYLFDEHPGDNYFGKSFSYNSRRIPASEIIHAFYEDRPGQLHGVPEFHAGMVKARDHDALTDAKIKQQQVAACFAGYIHDIDFDDSQDEEVPELASTIEPGAMPFLPPGKNITFSDPPSVEGSAAFNQDTLQELAAGFGVTYDGLTSNLKDVNFTSGRLGRGDYFRQVDQYVKLTFIPQVCEKLWKWFDETANIMGLVPGYAEADWWPNPHPEVDPGKETNAAKTKVRCGFDSLSQYLRSRGRDPRKHLEQIAKDIEMLDELGLVVDVDPRKIGGGGTAQKQENIDTEEE